MKRTKIILKKNKRINIIVKFIFYKLEEFNENEVRPDLSALFCPWQPCGNQKDDGVTGCVWLLREGRCPLTGGSVTLELGFHDVGRPYPDTRKIQLPCHFQFVLT